MDQYKSPLEQSNALINDKNPFNPNSISHDRHVTPNDLFDNHRLTKMSPNDYYKFVSHQIGQNPEDLIKHRMNHPNEISIDDMRKMMREGTKFDTAWLRLSDDGEPGTTSPYWQEGLHRMLAAGQEYGMDTKFPVYIGYENDSWDDLDTMSMDDFIKHYDDTRLKRYNERKQREKDEEEANNAYWRREAAKHFKIPEEQATQEHIDKYIKFLDILFKDEWND